MLNVWRKKRVGSHGHRDKGFLWWFESSFDSLAWAGVGDQAGPAGLYKGSPQQTRVGCFHAPRIVAVPEQDIGKTLKRKENLHLGLLVMWQKKGRDHVISLKTLFSQFLFFCAVFLVVIFCKCCSHISQKQMDGWKIYSSPAVLDIKAEVSTFEGERQRMQRLII